MRPVAGLQGRPARADEWDMSSASDPVSRAAAAPAARLWSGAALRLLVACGALLHACAAAVFVWLAARRLFYPLELGHVEGVLMDTIRRLVMHQPIYPAPTFDFVPLAYMPGYFIVVAPFVQIFGDHLWVGRAVAVAETLLTAALLARIVRRETGRWSLALIAPGLFLGAYGFCGGSYDLVQPNSQLVLLAFLGVALLRETTGRAGAIAAAACLGFSFLTKQHGLLFGVAMLPWLWLHDRRRLAAYAVTLAAVAGGGYALMNAYFGGWFTFYTYDVPSHWSTFDLIKIENLGRYLFGVFGVSTTLTLFSLLPGARRAETDGGPSIWWWAAGGGFATAALATLDPYSFRHTLMPMVTALALVAPMAAWHIARRLTDRAVPLAAALAGVLWLLSLQYVPMLFSVRHYIPQTNGRALRDALYQRLHQIPGRTLILNHGFYLPDAGERPSLHLLGLEDILRSEGNALARRDPTYFDRQFATLMNGPGRPWLVTDVPLEDVGDRSNRYWRVIARGYAVRDSFPALAEALLPSAGLQQSPRYVYAPVEPPAAPAAPAPR